MIVPLPAILTRQIAQSALKRAREYAIMRGWTSADKLASYFADGEAGVKSTVRYLVYQDRGTIPRLMIELEGKTIPIRDNSGNVNFVKVTGVGTSGWVTIPGDATKPRNQLFDSNAATPGRIWRNQKWMHPGIKPTHFLRNSIEKSVDNSGPLIRNYIKENVFGKKIK
jgi:hypothetical protein